MSGTSTNDHYDYAIIGMGIGGLTLGALLAKPVKKSSFSNGTRYPVGMVTLFGRADFPFAPNCITSGIAVLANASYRMLKKLGLEETGHLSSP